jgi:homocysteine S-methyltransferase
MIVDGGLGAELERRGFTFTTKLWSSEAVMTAPDLLVAIHRDFLAAGAQIIETATYQLSHAGLRALGYDGARIDAVFADAIGLARRAVAEHTAERDWVAPRPVVAASLGPYGATVGDGSEYSGVQHLAAADLAAFHAERLATIARAAPDLIIFETIPSLHEALVIAAAARELELPIWLSFACRDSARTYADDPIDEAARRISACANVTAIGVNCTAPIAIAPLVRAIRSATAKPIYACPNLGQQWEDRTHGLAGGGTEAAFLGQVRAWLELGVAHVGGCCGVGPPTIAALAAIVGPARGMMDQR